MPERTILPQMLWATILRTLRGAIDAMGFLGLLEKR